MQGRLFSGLIILTIAISIGCGGGSGTNGDVAAGHLAVSPSKLNFGNVPVGTTKGETATLTAGDSSITVTSADWSGEGYSISGIVFPLTVPAGQSVSFKVTFAPQRGGNAPGNIRFLSNALNSPHAEAFNGNGKQAGAHRVSLSWHSTASAVVGYNIYRGSAAKGPYTKINASPHPDPTFTDASVHDGQTYFYMTTAVDKAGRESKYSNQVQIMLPNS
jgi:uncharacterized protein YfiM (DUF2279 family)